MFMVSKAIEYFQKFAHGITPGTNPFFMWYFTLTGIHLIHVVVGTEHEHLLWIRSRRGTYDHLHKAVPESVASYWHLVDLLWVVLSPSSTCGGLPACLRRSRTAWRRAAGGPPENR